MRFLTIVFLFVCFFSPLTVRQVSAESKGLALYGPMKVKCRHNRKLWCVEYGMKAFGIVLKTQEFAISIKKENHILRSKVESYKSNQDVWKNRASLWGQERSSLARIQKHTSDQNTVLAKRNLVLEQDNKTLRNEKNSFWNHPALWTTVGIVVGVTMTVVVVYVSRNNSTNSNSSSLTARVPTMNLSQYRTARFSKFQRQRVITGRTTILSVR